jgi:hypothetical protein
MSFSQTNAKDDGKGKFIFVDYSLDEQQDVTKGGATKPPRGSNGKVSVRASKALTQT